MNLLIKNVRIENAPQLTDIRIKDGKFAQLEAGLEAQGGEQIVDGGGRLVLPPYIESHVHLDSALTSGQPRSTSPARYLKASKCGANAKVAHLR